MALPENGSTHLIPALLLIYQPRKDERLSWPSWLTCSGWFIHISGHPSAAGRAQDRESSPVRDRRSTTVLRHQHLNVYRSDLRQIFMVCRAMAAYDHSEISFFQSLKGRRHGEQFFGYPQY